MLLEDAINLWGGQEDFYNYLNSLRITRGGLSKADFLDLFQLVYSNKKEGMNICEVGTWYGCGSILLAAIVKEMYGKLTSVDWFKGGETSNLQESANYFNIKNIFKENVEKFKFNDIVNLIEKKSEEAVKQFSDEYFDIVFIDADHRYSSIKQDLDLWYPKVKQGGIICGHDCDISVSDIPNMLVKYSEYDYLSGMHFGVLRALYEKFPDAIKCQNSVIWYKEKPKIIKIEEPEIKDKENDNTIKKNNT